MTVTAHPAFEHIRSVHIAALSIDMEEYRHKKTGAIHYHMAADNNENVFLVALRTVPMDHKGVAHILEHTALCGSEKYPVRDPFFMMIRRSLNTFMNAFTSNDWTAYPFSSQNYKDFNNLLDVYLDAVFFSRLDELDFMQEGHRIEFKDKAKPDDGIEYKGVVFNEMKGAMSSVSSVLWQTLCKHLFPSTTYHYNSGGDPEYITDLSYDELIHFYKKHYHPSNAIFMTFGDITAQEHQKNFEEKALHRFEMDDEIISIGREKRYQAPMRVQEAYAYDSTEGTEQQTHITLGWLLGQNTSLKDVISAQILSYALMENSACPLQHYLETTELGTAPSPMCGLEDSYHELVFVCGISGSEAERAEQFEKEVLAIIQKVADEGIDQKRLEAIVHQIELSHREISGDGYPYGLQLILTALPSVTHRGDPISLLDLDPVLEDISEAIKDPDYIKDLARELLLENQHRVLLTMTPDTELSKRKQQAEQTQLEQIFANLDEKQKQDIIDKTEALEKRQAQVDDISILPKVGLEDVPAELHIAEGHIKPIHDIPVHQYNQGTNGLAYMQVVMPLPQLSDELMELLPIYSQCMTEVGIGDKTFIDVQHWQSEVVGQISSFYALRGSVNDEQHVPAYFIITSKALIKHHKEMINLIRETLENVRFDETSRIKDIVSQYRARKLNSITGNGHALAMTAAASGMSPLAKLNENWGGMNGIKKLRALDDNLKEKTHLEDLCQKLETIHKAILSMPMQILSVAEEEHQDMIAEAISHEGFKLAESDDIFSPEPLRTGSKVAWLANTQVNFCAKAYPTVPANHADAPALTVLGGFLRNGYLHTAIREKGGAYGSGATQDTNCSAFKFYSYRDPRITGTLDDFDKSIEWMLTTQHSEDKLEEAILGVIGSLDKPVSPAGEAKHAFSNLLFGRTPEQRQTFRNAVLAVTLEDLKRVTETYLVPEKASIGVISHEGNRAEVEGLGLQIEVL